MDLSEMTKEELIELVQQLQFSLQESHKVIKKLAKQLPSINLASNKSDSGFDEDEDPLSITQELNKHDIFRLYEYIVAADVFNGIDDETAKQKAFDTIIDMLEIEGIDINRDSLSKYFPANT